MFGGCFSHGLLRLFFPGGIGLSYILLYQDDERMQCLSVCTAAAILVLTKDSGLFFSITLLTAYFFTKITEKSSSEAKYHNIFPDLGLALISVALPKILWNLHLKQKGTALVFREPVTLPELAQILMQKDETWKQVCWNSYFPKLISNDVKMGWYLKIRTSYFVWTLICIAIGLLLLFLIKKRESSSKQVAVGKIILIAAVIQLIVYVIGMAFAYVTQFEEPEAIDHAAMTRYIGVVFLGLVVVLFSLATEVFAKESYKHAIGTILCAILVFQMCPWGILKRYATRMYVEESITERREYEQLAEELHAITPEGKAWLIVQQDSGAVYHIVKFSVRPVQVQTGQWSLSGDPKSDEWMDQLCESYDAVVVFRTDDEFVDQYGELFDNPGSVEDRSIYIVDPEKRKLVCISS